MRSRGATFLAEQGLSGNLIQAIGWWSSEAFNIYIQKNPVLLHHIISSSIASSAEAEIYPFLALGLTMHKADFPSSSYKFDGATYSEEASSVIHDLYIPRYMQGFAWRNTSCCSSVTASYTDTNSPLLRPPLEEFSNVPALWTIENYNDLLDVSTGIKTDEMRHLLDGLVPGSCCYPNMPFVDSVITMLEDSSWLHARTQYNDGYPLIHDNSVFHPKSEEQCLFLNTYSQEEEEAGCHS
ncbi:hypothetical protein PQX77_019612 [Marasmius sp. AFHP31]|nr:hypothetical protein PQX77_019612 [Marasmius sp. AFHP31]